jgi:acyl carrier protein
MAMTEQEILAGFAVAVEEHAGVPAGKVTPQAGLTGDLEIDSLSMVEVIIAAQDKFGVEIPDRDLRSLTTVQDVVSYVWRVQHSGMPA